MHEYHIMLDGFPMGPFSAAEAQQKIAGRKHVLVWREGFTNWVPAEKIGELSGGTYTPPAPPSPPEPKPEPQADIETPATPKRTAPSICDEVDFVLYGSEMQFVEIELDPEESVIAEAGSMMYKEASVEMQTLLGDGSDKGIFGKLFGAGKRVLTGESLFITVFTHRGKGKAKVAFGAPYPGNIVPVSLQTLGGSLICQKDAFLCAARGVSVGIHFQRKILTALFGGEGFVLQKLEGDGMAFLHAGGTIVERELRSGEELHVDTGCLVAYEPKVSFEIQRAGGIKTSLFGGEGFFLARLRGPGKIWMQSLPFSRLAGRLAEALPDRGGDKGED